jgi:hypothetical protein
MATWLVMEKSLASVLLVSLQDQLVPTLLTLPLAQLGIREASMLCITRKMGCLLRMLLGKLRGRLLCLLVGTHAGLVRLREALQGRTSILDLPCGSGFDLRFNGMR